MSTYQKLDSPELHPLPPLPQHNFLQNYGNSHDASSCSEDKDEEEEEFYSPKGSSGVKGTPTTSPASSSQGVHMGADAENFRSRSSHWRATLYPPSGFASPTHSMPCSPFIPPNLSPISFLSTSPESIIGFPSFFRPPPAITRSPLLSKLLSPSPPSTPQKKDSDEDQNSPVIDPDVAAGRKRGPPLSMKLPTPSPPPMFSEIPIAEAELIKDLVTGPPVLVAPSRPVVQSAEPVSPGGQTHNLEIPQRNEETLRLKPLHWGKVRASSDRLKVLDRLKSGSFELNEEMIETSFVVNASCSAPKDSSCRFVPPMPNRKNLVLDPKKSQDIAILLRALNITTDEVCEALREGSTDILGTELLDSLLKMAPTKEEECKLKEFEDESPLSKLGPSEKFLRAVLDIPFAFKRVDAMLYMANFDSEVEYLKRSFETLEAACAELKNSRMFQKLVEAAVVAVNSTNVGTNHGDARDGFNLDALLKLVEIKGSDGKTTLLNFVIQEISKAEGSLLARGGPLTGEQNESEQSRLQDDIEFRKRGLQVVSGLSGELTNVKKAATMDSGVLSCEVAKLAGGIAKIRKVLRLSEEIGSEKFCKSMNQFLKKAGAEIEKIESQERVVLSLVKEITEYFHGVGDSSVWIFVAVKGFLSKLDQACKQVGKVYERSIISSSLGSSTMFPGWHLRA